MGAQETDRVWFITGSGSGLGRELAEAALERGERVVATGRDPQELRGLEKSHPDQVLAQQLDVTDPGQADRAVEAAIERFGRIDVLVSNAGFGLFGPLEELDDEEIRREFDTNVFGAVNVMRAGLPAMRRQRSGQMVHLIARGCGPGRRRRGRLRGDEVRDRRRETLAKDVAHLGIGVTIVEPGPIRTDFAGGAIAREPSDPDYEESVGKALTWSRTSRASSRTTHAGRRGDHRGARLATAAAPPGARRGGGPSHSREARGPECGPRHLGAARRFDRSPGVS